MIPKIPGMATRGSTTPSECRQNVIKGKAPVDCPLLLYCSLWTNGKYQVWFCPCLARSSRTFLHNLQDNFPQGPPRHLDHWCYRQTLEDGTSLEGAAHCSSQYLERLGQKSLSRLVWPPPTRTKVRVVISDNRGNLISWEICYQLDTKGRSKWDPLISYQHFKHLLITQHFFENDKGNFNVTILDFFAKHYC